MQSLVAVDAHRAVQFVLQTVAQGLGIGCRAKGGDLQVDWLA